MNQPAFIHYAGSLLRRKLNYVVYYLLVCCFIDLLGHATLATAHTLFTHLRVGENGVRKLTFKTLSGDLFVEQKENGLIEMDFPQGSFVNLMRSNA